MPPSSPAPSREFLSAFHTHSGPEGSMSFGRFMALALYDPEVGYYRQHARRVGYGDETDFFTSATSGPVFGELVAAAVRNLLEEQEAKDFTFVEIGAEPAAPGDPAPGILSGVEHGFGSSRVIGVGDEIQLAGPCVVFANELFDAQPFERYIYRQREWHGLGVAEREGLLREVELTDPVDSALLPPEAPEGTHFDAPLGSVSLLESIAGQPWSGLFLTCDYGRTLRELLEEYPEGTARAYHRHTQSAKLLDRPGEQDLTCHICWDWLVDVLRRHGFESPQVEAQESFFVRRAEDFLANATAREAGRFSRRKLSFLQLLHPAHLGQKFQVLWARRPSRSTAR